jgi:tetratricopeptide (TPR) repeat protein
MAKPKPITLTEEGVITQDALLAYAEGRLGAADSAQLEKLLRDDPFAQDALEGMRSSQNKADINTAITSINTKLREKTGAREHKKKGIEIHWANYAYAAVVLGVLVGVGYIMIHVLVNNSNNNLAENKNVPQAQESTPVIEAKKDTIKTDSLTAQAQKHISDSITTAIAMTTQKASDTTTSSATQKDLNGSMTTGNNAAQTADGKTTEAVSQNAVAKSATKSESKDKQGLDPGSPLLLSAKSYFDSGDYINAEKGYKEVLAKDPENLDALYFGGVSSYLNRSWGLGETNFDKLLKTNAYTDGSKWYKANILIIKGQKEDAKKLLRDVSNSNSRFKDRAVKRYEELLK